MKKLLVLGLLLTTPALAQQQPQQTPSQLALQLQQVIGQWAQALEALQQQNSTLTKENAELKSKLEAKEKENAK